jgi:predicted transcriptional regulator
MRSELQVMELVAAAVGELEPTAQTRVIRWVVDALGIPGFEGGAKATAAKPSGEEVNSTSDVSSFAEFFHLASPKIDKEKALVAAYWVQKNSGSQSFGSQQLNTELKQTGYGVSNITDALNQIINEKPSCIIQLTKSGSSQQARKTYKITDAGIRRVREMIELNSMKDK